MKLFLLSLLPVISILRPGTYESSDINFHITSSMVFFESLKEGNFFPIWGGGLNYSFGYPIFLFTYPFPLYVVSLFHFVGFTFLISIKLILILSYVFSGLFFYLWLRNKFNEISAFAGAIFYLYAPYHLVDLHFRVALGEVVSMVFIPIIFYAFDKFLKTENYLWLFLETVAMSLLILSHPAISLSVFIFFSLYLLTEILNSTKNKRKFLSMQIVSLLISLGLIGFYLIPVIFEQKYTHYEYYSQFISFASLKQLVLTPWYGGFLYQGPKGELGFLVGYMHMMVILVVIYFFIRKLIKQKFKNITLLFLAFYFVTIFMMLPYSKILWENLPFFKSFQFSIRLLVLNFFISSFLAAVLIYHLNNKKLVYLLCLLTIAITFLNWGNRRNIPQIKDPQLKDQITSIVKYGGGYSQAAPRWTDAKNPWALKEPESNVEIVSGEGVITTLKRQNQLHEYLIKSNGKLLINENTLFFPGWNAYVDQEKVNILISNTNNSKGIISLELPKGTYKLIIKFEKTRAMIIGECISFFSILILFLLIMLNFSIGNFNTRNFKKI